ncbi:MAG: PAS domain S-box protein [Alkalispirochaeta sp.]
MERAQIGLSELHKALFRLHIRPMVVADRLGCVVEWNDAAGEWTGLKRERVLGRPLWEVQASVAPATIPYEKACSAARDTFLRLVHQSEREDRPWHLHTDGDILSATGTVRHIHSETFPVWVGSELVIVSTFTDENGYAPSDSSDAVFADSSELPQTATAS